MCIKDYETEIGGQGPVRAVELVEKIETFINAASHLKLSQRGYINI
jgi:hypothetical protein